MVTQENSYPIDVTALQQRNFVNYSTAANKGDYMIITTRHYERIKQLNTGE